MLPKVLHKTALIILLALTGAACAPTPTPHLSATLAASPVPSATPPTTIPTITPSPTQPLLYLSATVWQSDPVAPILLYHRFKTNRPSTLNLVSRLDFQEEMEKLYASDYVTVSLERWLAGDLRVPAGKRPLVLSMDDLFYRNQITLTPEGIPSEQTGLGVAWKFSQEHPGFGFHWALFANLGDKPYGEGTPAEQENQLANVIVWCIENDAMVYNHTFHHAMLSQTDGPGVTAELKWNDDHLRELLTRVNREDLIPKLGNLFAIPYGKWPRSEEAMTALYDYSNPEGLPLQGVFDVDYIIRPKFMAAPYSNSFDKWKLPRMVANLAAVDYLAENKDTIPAAQTCKIGPLDGTQVNNSNYMGEQIHAMIQNGQCPEGIYAMENFIFRADAAHFELIQEVTKIQ